MAIEYKLKNQENDKIISNIEKAKSKLLTSINKEFDGIKNLVPDNNDFEEKTESLKTKICSSIEKELLIQSEGLKSICTISSTKIYWEISIEEIEEIMNNNPGKYVIIDDNDNVIKNIAAFKKIVVAAEKSFE